MVARIVIFKGGVGASARHRADGARTGGRGLGGESRVGSIAAADVVVDGASVCTVVSVYAAWEVAASRRYADGSAHLPCRPLARVA